jgi:iron complex outermembrane receptor protein
MTALLLTAILSGTLTVRVRNGAAPIAGAVITAAGSTATSDARGTASLSLPVGTYDVSVQRPGFGSATAPVEVRAGEETTVTVQLSPVQVPTEVVTVQATRSGRVVEDQPLRVEAVPEDEIEENLTVAPGNLSTLLTELPGVHMQVASSSLGGASMRLQGLRGRYTQILQDELPLFGDTPDVFSLLQVPPLDLAQVEVVKGAASALYGGSALGGVINLVSLRPPAEPEALASVSSFGGWDTVGFVPARLSSDWGLTALGGLHRQSRKDVDDDGWTDVAGYERGELRPRFLWNGGPGRSLFLTAGFSSEEREGGTVNGGTTPAGDPFDQSLDTQRADVGLVGSFLVHEDRVLAIRGSFTDTTHDLVFDTSEEHDHRQFGFVETSLSGIDHGHTWLFGAAIERDLTRLRELGGFDYTYTVPALFVQDEFTPTRGLTLSASGRADFHSEFGTLLDVRISGLVRPAPAWSIRLSAGTGHAAPTPHTEETDVVGLSRVLPFQVDQAERAHSALLDVGWSHGSWEVDGTLFASDVSHPLILRDFSSQPGMLELINAASPTRTYGSELFARFAHRSIEAIVNYSYLHSVGEDATGPTRQDVPLTPWHTAELAAIWEQEGRGRFGIEVSYTGRQRLEDDPYREVSPSFVTLNALGEVDFGETGVFLNAINVTDVRQSHYDPLVRPTQAPDGGWTTDAWAPIEGRTFNAGVRWEF